MKITEFLKMEKESIFNHVRECLQQMPPKGVLSEYKHSENFHTFFFTYFIHISIEHSSTFSTVSFFWLSDDSTRNVRDLSFTCSHEQADELIKLIEKKGKEEPTAEEPECENQDDQKETDGPCH